VDWASKEEGGKEMRNRYGRVQREEGGKASGPTTEEEDVPGPAIPLSLGAVSRKGMVVSFRASTRTTVEYSYGARGTRGGEEGRRRRRDWGEGEGGRAAERGLSARTLSVAEARLG
jgi:hypothetical protein